MKHVNKILYKMENGCTNPLFSQLEDGSNVIIKVFNNEQGNIPLVNELICYHLAKELELPIPESGVCFTNQDTISDDSVLDFFSKINFGPAFYSKAIDRATILKNSKVLNFVDNKDIIPKIILFDHIIQNRDRNPGNCLISQSKNSARLNIIDHSHVFELGTIWVDNGLYHHIEIDFEQSQLFNSNRYIYNMFMECMSIKKDNLLLLTNEFHSKINTELLDKIFSLVPKEWDVSQSDFDLLRKFILYRVDNIDILCDAICNNIKKGVCIC